MENAAAPGPAAAPTPAPAQSELVLKAKKIGNKYMAFIAVVGAIVSGLGYVASASDKVERARTQGVGTVIREIWIELKGTKEDQNCKRCAGYNENCKRCAEYSENCKRCAEYSKKCYDGINLIIEHLKIRVPVDAKSGIKGIGYMPKSLDGTSGNGSLSPMSLSFTQVYNSNKPRHAYDTIEV